MTRAPAFKEPAQKAADCAAAMQQQAPQPPGWAPKAGEEPDLLTTAWFVMALKTARIAGLKVDSGAFQRAMRFVEKLSDEKGRCRNRPADEKPAAEATAAGLVCLLETGTPSTDPKVAGGAELLLTALPVWDPQGTGVDLGHWFLGSLAAYNAGTPTWREWNEALNEALKGHQAKGGEMDGSGADKNGSWEPFGAWGQSGGRAAAVALGALCLETPWHMQAPIYWKWKD
jgi:hypothetical protein